MNEEIVKWLPLIIALVAGFFALHQIRSNNITNARIKWLENFKALISDFFSECADLLIKEHISTAVNEKRKSELINEKLQTQIDKMNESIIGLLKIINAKHDLIKLNLNPKELLHQKFESLFDRYMELLNAIPNANKTIEDLGIITKEMDNYSDTIILLLRYIMKLEWEKTKRAYLFRSIYMYFGKGRNLLNEALTLPIQQKRK